METVEPGTRLDNRAKPRRVRLSDGRFFYAFAAAINLLLLLIGFAPYFLHRLGEGGRILHPVMLGLDFAHGLSITTWYILLLAQALLVPLSWRRLHMKLGWLSVALVPLVTISSVMTALRSVREMPDMVRFAMPYPQFLLVMLTNVGVFLACAVAGIALRRRPTVHRVLMLTASLSLLGGATSRIFWLDDIFGGDTRSGYFGPVIAWGAVLTILGSLRRGALDRRLAAGYALIVISNLAAATVAGTDSWGHWAQVLTR